MKCPLGEKVSTQLTWTDMGGEGEKVGCPLQRKWASHREISSSPSPQLSLRKDKWKNKRKVFLPLSLPSLPQVLNDRNLRELATRESIPWLAPFPSCNDPLLPLGAVSFVLRSRTALQHLLLPSAYLRG